MVNITYIKQSEYWFEKDYFFNQRWWYKRFYWPAFLNIRFAGVPVQKFKINYTDRNYLNYGEQNG